MEIDRIYFEDCLSGMSRIKDKSIDMILCDPPYGVLNRNNKNARWDNIIPFEPLWEQYERVIKDNGAIVLFAQGMFTAQFMMSNPKIWRYNLIWDKVGQITGFLNANRKPLSVHEDIMIFYKHQPTYNPQFTFGEKNHHRGGQSVNNNRCYGKFEYMATRMTNEKYPQSIVRFKRDCNAGKIHPTQKPVELLRWLIRTYTNSGELVLDNCMGSGSTAIAAIRERRHFIGFEITEEYYNASLSRIENELANPTLF